MTPLFYKLARPGVRAFRAVAAGCGVGFSPNDRALLAYRGRHRGKRAFLVGNGPSLRVSDLEALRDELTFAANKIYLSFGETEWRPDYYFVEDNLVLQQNWERIAAFDDCPKFLPRKALQWERPVPGALYYRFAWEDPEKEGFPSFGSNPVTGFYWGSTVVYSMLQMAAFMGCDPIYLIGVDFSFSVPGKAEGIELTSEGEVNHFHKDYRKPGEKWNVPNLEVQLKTFRQARAFIESRGGRIFNATRGGKLEVLPRADLDVLLTGRTTGFGEVVHD